MTISLAVTACANGLNVEDYFYRLLTSDEPVMPWNEWSGRSEPSADLVWRRA
ncbi:MAG: hypothetical protein ACI4XF_05145 [Oscillospiraceae bacterium]